MGSNPIFGTTQSSLNGRRFANRLPTILLGLDDEGHEVGGIVWPNQSRLGFSVASSIAVIRASFD